MKSIGPKLYKRRDVKIIIWVLASIVINPLRRLSDAAAGDSHPILLILLRSSILSLQKHILWSRDTLSFGKSMNAVFAFHISLLFSPSHTVLRWSLLPLPSYLFQHLIRVFISPGQEYRACGPGCVRTCDNFEDLEKNPDDCPISSTDGCTCPEGMVSSSSRFVFLLSSYNT